MSSSRNSSALPLSTVSTSRNAQNAEKIETKTPNEQVLNIKDFSIEELKRSIQRDKQLLKNNIKKKEEAKQNMKNTMVRSIRKSIRRMSDVRTRNNNEKEISDQQALVQNVKELEENLKLKKQLLLEKTRKSSGQNRKKLKNPTTKLANQSQKFETNDFQTFTKREGTTEHGREFETLIISNMVLDMVAAKEATNFHLSSDDKNFGAFDDIVCDVENNDGTCEKYAVQLKYKNSPEKGSFQNALSSNDGNFGIYKYFKSFQEKKEYLEDYNLILFTNWKTKMVGGERLSLDFNCKAITVKVTKHHFTQFPDGKCFKFKMSPQCDVDEACREFFKKFYVLTDQLNVSDLKNAIPGKLLSLPFCTNAVSNRFLEQITDWSKLEGTKSKLNKSMIQNILSLNSLDSQSICFGPKSVAKTEESFCNLVAQFDVTVFSEQSLEKIRNFWGYCTDLTENDYKDMNLANKLNLIIRLETAFNQKNFEKLDNIAKSKLLWLIGKRPLIVKTSDLAYKAMQVLTNKNIILVGEPCFKLLKEYSVFKTLADTENLDSVKDLCENLKCFIPNEVTLNHLLKNDNLKQFVTPDLLLNMLESPYTFPIGTEEFSTIYIDRFLCKTVVGLEYLESVDDKTLIVISGVEKLSNYSFLTKFKTVWINETFKEKTLRSPLDSLRKATLYLHSEMCSKAAFDEICAKNNQMRKFHHFKITHGQYLEWISSNSDVSELQQFRKESTKLMDKDSISACNNVNVICGNPGMGKSWFLRKLKDKLSSTHFTILFNALEMKQICKIFHSNKSFEDFVIELKYSHFTDFEKCVLKKCIQDGRVVFLWDALDEINNDNEIELITDFIKKKVSENNTKHWISCRRHLQASTERKFNVLSSLIGEFNEKQQLRYITERLKNVYSTKDTTAITKKIRDHVAFIKFNEILSIPLQIYMLTDIFLTDNQLIFSLKTGSFSIVNVYEKFVEQKFKIFYTDKLKISSLDLLTQQKILKIRFLQKASLCSIFGRKILDKLQISLDELNDCDNDPFGFITKHKPDQTKIQFAHISYAEYFAACYFAKNCLKAYKSFLFQEKYTNVRFFFDMLLAEHSPAHQAVLYKNYEALKKCKKDDLLKADLGGRSALQVACSWAQRYPLLHFTKKANKTFVLKENYQNMKSSLDFEFMKIIEFLLDKKVHLCKFVDCFEMDFFGYATISNCWFVLTLLDRKMKTLYFQSRLRAAFSLLFYAALNDCNIDCILQQLPYVPNIQTINGETLLYLCSIRGNMTVAELLVNRNFNVNAADFRGRTPLYEACFNSYDKMAELFIGKEANVNAADKDGVTPLHLAAHNGLEKVVKLLMCKGANVNAADKDGFTPLYVASHKGLDRLAKLLVSNRANVNAAGKDGFTPLHAACENGHEKVAELLISKRADANAANGDGFTPLYIASQYGHEKLVKMLINKDVDVNAADNAGFTPLYTASHHGHEKVVELLINRVDVNRANKAGITPLYAASENGHEKVASLLISKGARVNAPDMDGFTPFYLACHNGHEQLAELLINSGVNVNAAYGNGFTPLYAAAHNGHEKVADLLISKGAKVNAADKNGWTPLIIACHSGHKKVAELLISKEGDVNAADKDGFTPLYVAAQNGHETVAELLISNGANVDAASKDGFTPLYVASKMDHKKVATLLISKGANVGAVKKHRSCQYL